MSANSILETKQLGVSINNKFVCKNLDLEILPGQCWGVLGINGAGKTTLMHTLAGLRAPISGEVLLYRENLHVLSRKNIAQVIGLLLQDHVDFFPSTVLETALIGRHPFLGKFEMESDVDIDIAKKALQCVGLNGMEQRLINTLSGGERRRLGLATLLTQNPILYLLDEPTNHLDLSQQINLLNMLTTHKNIADRAIVMILHDINLAVRYCNQLLFLFDKGETLNGPTAEVLTTENLSQLFSHQIIKLDTPDGPFFVPK